MAIVVGSANTEEENRTGGEACRVAKEEDSALEKVEVVAIAPRLFKITTLTEELTIACQPGWAVNDLQLQIAARKGIDPKTVCFADVSTGEAIVSDKQLSDHVSNAFAMVIRKLCNSCNGNRQKMSREECHSCGGTGEGWGRYNSRCKVCKGSGDCGAPRMTPCHCGDGFARF